MVFTSHICYLNTYSAILCVPIHAQGRAGQSPVLCTCVQREGTKQSLLHKDQAVSCISKPQKKVGYKVLKTYFVAVSPFLILISWYQTALLQESRPKEPLKDPQQIRSSASYYPVLNQFLSQVYSRYSECSEIKL